MEPELKNTIPARPVEKRARSRRESAYITKSRPIETRSLIRGGDPAIMIRLFAALEEQLLDDIDGIVLGEIRGMDTMLTRALVPGHQFFGAGGQFGSHRDIGKDAH